MRTLVARASVLASVFALAGCPAQPGAPQFDTGAMGVDAATHDSGPAPLDAGTDAGIDAGAPASDAGVDAASPASDAGMDAATSPDANVADAFTASDANTVDAFASDAAMFDAGPVTCASAGGSCVALTPTSCPAPGMVGDARHYTCGGGLGTECCLPGAPSMAPVCMNTGTAAEGWYQPDGTLICMVACAGLTARCQRIGTPSQGWYTTSTHGCPPHSQEIISDSTCM